MEPHFGKGRVRPEGVGFPGHADVPIAPENCEQHTRQLGVRSLQRSEMYKARRIWQPSMHADSSGSSLKGAIFIWLLLLRNGGY